MKINLEPSREWERWLAWHPIFTGDGAFVWMETVVRRWDDKKYLRIVDMYDRGDYEGGWEYKELT